MHQGLIRILAVAAGLNIGLGGVCAAQSGSLSLSLNANAAPGFVSLNVVLTAASAAPPAAIQWTLNYAAADVAGIAAVAGPAAIAADKTLTCASPRCVLWGINTRTIQSGVVAVLTLNLANTASSRVAFQLLDALAASVLADPIFVGAGNGPLAVITQPPVFTPAVAAGLGFRGSAAQVVWAGGWDTTIHLINTGGGVANARTQLFGDDGSPLTTALNFPQSQDPSAWLAAASLDQTLAAGATLVIDSTGADSQGTQIGSAQLSTAGNVGGFVRFRYAPIDQEAAVPLEIRNAGFYVLAFDSTNGLATGVGLANLTAAPANIPVVIRDNSGIQIDSGNISLPARGHFAFVAGNQFPRAAGQSGTLEFDTPAGFRISVLGLRFSPSGRFTTIPVAASNDTTGAGSLAHLVVGGGWTTSIQLINLGNTTAQAHLRFFDDNGGVLPIPVSSSPDPVLPPNSTVAIESTDTDDSALRTGSARLTSNGAVTGFIRFRYGPQNQEAIVPLETRNAGSYILEFDNTGGLATGVAVANLASSDGAISAIIRDTAGAPLGFETLAIPANGHSAFVLADRFRETVNQRGTVAFVTPPGGQVSVLGLRFPASGMFSTIPVVTP